MNCWALVLFPLLIRIYIFSNLYMIRDSEGTFHLQLQRFMAALNTFNFFIDGEVVYLDFGSGDDEITGNPKGLSKNNY